MSRAEYTIDRRFLRWFTGGMLFGATVQGLLGVEQVFTLQYVVSCMSIYGGILLGSMIGTEIGDKIWPDS